VGFRRCRVESRLDLFVSGRPEKCRDKSRRAIWELRGGIRATPASIAVLPFLNLSGDSGKEHLGDSLTGELTEVFAQSSSPRGVRARSSGGAYIPKS
jgi:TolB-like protein